MDMHVANGLISNSYLCSSENAEINIDNIVAAVAELNVKILTLREEIIAFKNANMISSIAICNSSNLTPAGFNHSTKNGENRTGARYEPRRNFKGDDSPGGTDLSARLSFAKRAREVKAANEATVFKEDYPRDDKSIEDDERPNRSHGSESGTYRKSISDAEKSGKEIDERPGNTRDTGDARISHVANEKLRNELNEQQNEVVNETNCSPVNVFTSKIKRKRISRGVQCVSIRCYSHSGRFCFNYFKSKSKRHSLTWKAKRKNASANKFNVGQNKVNRLSDTAIINDSYKMIKKKLSDINIKKLDKVSEENIERITYANNKKLSIQMQNTHDGEKLKDDLKYNKVKINLLEKLRLRRALIRKNDSKVQQNESQLHESRNHKEEITRLSYENKRMTDVRKCEDNSQSVKIVNCEMDSSNERKTITTANTDRESEVNKIKKRLDSYIAELNRIIGDACAIFNNRKESNKE